MDDPAKERSEHFEKAFSQWLDNRSRIYSAVQKEFGVSREDANDILFKSGFDFPPNKDKYEDTGTERKVSK